MAASCSWSSLSTQEEAGQDQGPLWAPRREGRGLGSVGRGGVRALQVLDSVPARLLGMRSMIDAKLLQEVSQEVLLFPAPRDPGLPSGSPLPSRTGLRPPAPRDCQAGSQPPLLPGIPEVARPAPSHLPTPNPQVLGRLPDSGHKPLAPSPLRLHPSRGPQEALPLFFKVPVQTQRQAQPPIKTLSPNSSLGPQHCSAAPWEDPQRPPLSPGPG